MAKNKKLPGRVGGPLQPKKGGNPIIEIIKEAPVLAKHLGNDRALLIVLSGMIVAGLIVGAHPTELVIVAALFLGSWAIGKHFNWFDK